MKYFLLFLILSLVAITLATENVHKKAAHAAGHNKAARKQNSHNTPAKLLVKNRKNANGARWGSSDDSTFNSTVEDGGEEPVVTGIYTIEDDNDQTEQNSTSSDSYAIRK